MAGRRLSGAKLERLCRMQAEAILSTEAMAQKLSVSAAIIETYLAKPEVAQRIEQLSRQHRAAGQRLANSRARWAIGRLIQLSSRDDETGRKALVDLLKLAFGQVPDETPTGQKPEEANSQMTEELTKHWTNNEWDIFAKLLASGSKEVQAAQAEN